MEEAGQFQGSAATGCGGREWLGRQGPSTPAKKAHMEDMGEKEYANIATLISSLDDSDVLIGIHDRVKRRSWMAAQSLCGM